MIVWVLTAAVLAAQALTLGRAWWGPLAADPMIVLATLLALSRRRRQIWWIAALLGWIRALVLVEAAGGQVLCALAAMLAVAAMRRGLLASGRGGFVLAAMLLAVLWWSVAELIRWVTGVPVSAGPELFLGAALALPLAWLLLPRGRLLGSRR